MTFTSLSFILYLPTVLLCYAILSSRLRWLLLLAASYFFYACLDAPHLLVVLAAVTAVSYVSGMSIHIAKSSTGKKFWLWAGIIANLSILIWLKYIPFLVEILHHLVAFLFPNFKTTQVNQLATIGASYFVFQAISYLIDIYLGILEPERHPGYFALSLGFFPKLLQGPIERGGRLMPQLRGLTQISSKNLQAGAHLFLWGMFKKYVVADRLATFVDPVYNNPNAYYGLSLIAATYLFALQIYFDFSGYTDMALGTARCFGIRLTQNFNAPYLAASTADFWRRWHISFSSWILDYIFKPLQMQWRDWPRWGTPLALMLTFLVSGLWHGAGWCFVAWGLLHGVYLGTAALFRESRRKLYKSLGTRLEKNPFVKAWRTAVTFNLICLSWVFFRCANIHDALYIAWNAVTGIPRSLSLLTSGDGEWSRHILLNKTSGECLGVLLLLVVTAGIGVVDRKTATDQSQSGEMSVLARFPVWAKGCIYGVLCYLIAFNGASVQSFIYLQF